MQLVTWFLSIYPFLNNLPLSLLHVNLIEDNNFIRLIASLCVGFSPNFKATEHSIESAYLTCGSLVWSANS